MGRSTRAKGLDNSKSKAKGNSAFEFCKVCKLNHNQGKKHKYFPSHTKAVDTILSRFRLKLSDSRSFLKNPAPLRLENTDRSRLWCVFCDSDVSDVGSSFACENVICHLASEEHLENLKKFLRKNGGKMDHVVSFTISNADLLKWKKKCEVIGRAVHFSNGMDGRPSLSSKDIQFPIKSSFTNSLDNNILDHFTPTFSYDVTPLQSLTTESHLSSYAKVSRDGKGTLISNVGGTSSSLESIDLYSPGKVSHLSIIKRPAVEPGYKSSLPNSNHKVDLSTFLGLDCADDPQKIIELSTEEKNSFIDGVSLPAQVMKQRKLNPERVGAEWAERRREQLAMEKRGEIVIIDDPCWLPNYGGVWQAGTRKEFRKEFEIEKRKGSKICQQTETPVTIQPYISKRMRLLSNGGEN